MNTENTETSVAEHLGVKLNRLAGDRDYRQEVVMDWVKAAFCHADPGAHTTEGRGVRFLEEAIELFQALGGTPAMIHKLIDHVYTKPPGEIAQEVGGVGVTLLALCQTRGISADFEEEKELRRVLSKPLEHFTQRHMAKIEKGL